MAGFGKTKEAQAAMKQDELPAHEKVDPFEALEAEREAMDDSIRSHTLMGLVGHDNTCKTAAVTYAYSKYLERFENQVGDDVKAKELWILDFDGGGAANKSAFYNDVKTIKCWEPFVYMTADRTAYNYADTHKRVMKILQYASQNAEELWGVLITGVDQWDSVCINNMRINDLGLAKDGIESADLRGVGDARRVEYQWDWAIRKSRFQQLTALCQALTKKGVKVFLETHLSMTNYSSGVNEANAKWRPSWEKSTNNFLFQILICEREDIYDDDGDLISQRFTATYEKSKTNPSLQGQKRVTLVTETGKEPTFYGLSELNDGVL
tara:strand:- start:808 stop:1776 length:969 start_codon:yes stop_codon:yes gene_type:complete